MTAPERLAKVAEDRVRRHVDALTQALHQRWHVGCNRECGGRLDDYLFAARLLRDPDGVLARIETAAEARGAARVREAVEALAAEWESWASTRSTPRIDAFRDAAEHLRAALDAAEKETQ